MKPTASHKIATGRSATSQETLKALLIDPNPCISSLAMEQMLQNRSQCEKFIADNQDSDELALRKCTHQLAGCLRLKLLQEQFVTQFEQGSLDAWNALLLVDQLYDQRSSSSYVQDLFLELLDNFQFTGAITLRKVAKYMKDRKFSAPPHPILNIGHYLVGDVLENFQGTALVLCLLVRQLARCHSLPLQLCLCGGKFCLADRNQNLLDPTEDWKVISAVAPDEMHACTSQEAIRIYLVQLLASSVMVWEVYDVHLFAQLLLRIEGLNREKLPYPYGNFLAPAPDPEP
ncbi:MAG: hypothetical protein IKR13_00970 [Victivallales bacterium]|nr:hypothetical protein [Victivallales bacterium]